MRIVQTFQAATTELFADLLDMLDRTSTHPSATSRPNHPPNVDSIMI
jgi:hypothetical protein